MPKEYMEYLTKASEWWLFFERSRAIEKVQELANKGFKVKLHQSLQQYTVFKMKEENKCDERYFSKDCKGCEICRRDISQD